MIETARIPAENTNRPSAMTRGGFFDVAHQIAKTGYCQSFTNNNRGDKNSLETVGVITYIAMYIMLVYIMLLPRTAILPLKNKEPNNDAPTVFLFALLLFFYASPHAHAFDLFTVHTMAYDETNDDILLGMEYAVVRWNGNDGITTVYDLNLFQTTSVYSDPFINEMSVAKDGAIWIASDNGLLRFAGNAWTQFTKADGLPDNVILTVALAPNGDVWVGTKYGAARFDGSSWQIYKAADGFLINEVKKNVVDTNNVVWIAPISTGIAAFDGENWKRYTTANGIPSGSVTDLLVDKKTISG